MPLNKQPLSGFTVSIYKSSALGPSERTHPIRLLPAGTDESDLIDVTPVGALFAKFVRRSTGKVVDCEEYARQAGMCL